MIIFDVLSHDSLLAGRASVPACFLTDNGYQKSLESQEKGTYQNSSAMPKCVRGNLYYDRSGSAALDGGSHEKYLRRLVVPP